MFTFLDKSNDRQNDNEKQSGMVSFVVHTYLLNKKEI